MPILGLYKANVTHSNICLYQIILTAPHPLLQVKMPVDGDPTRMQRGRVYICDLAGTEPAGDIVYAQYKKGAGGVRDG